MQSCLLLSSRNTRNEIHMCPGICLYQWLLVLSEKSSKMFEKILE
jgi:hypothetical protein